MSDPTGKDFETENLIELFKDAPEIFCLLNGEDLEPIFANETMLTLFAPSEAKSFINEMRRELLEVMHSGQSAHLHNIELSRKLTPSKYNFTCSPRRNRIGEIDGVMIVGREVMERQQRLWLESLLNRFPTALFLIDPKLNEVTFSNEFAKNMLGRTVDGTLPNQRYTGGIQVLDQSGRVLSADEIPSARAVKEFELRDEEFTLVTPKGQFEISASSRRLPAENLHEETILLLIQDVTLVKLARKALEKSEEQLQMALKVSKVGFYDWDIAKDIITFSPQMIADWGIDPKVPSFKLQSAIDRIHPEDQKYVMAEINRAMELNIPYEIEYRVMKTQSEVVWLDVKGQITRGIDGRPIRFFGTSVDITEKKIAEERLGRALSQAEAASAAKSQFLANMSHEIRTPLGAILGFTELLKGSHLSGEELEYLEVIDRNSQILTRVIDDILDLSKVEAGLLEIERVPFSLPDLINDVLALFSTKAKMKDIDLKLDEDSVMPLYFLSDPGRLRQILINLVGNAVKFTSEGSVTLSICGFPEMNHEGVLCIEVKDTGIGFDLDQAEWLFRPFTQGDTTSTRKFGGTGLGLALSKRLALALGGDVSVKSSSPREGSVFSLTISGKSLPSEKDKEDLKKQRPQFKRLKGTEILVVDDSPDNLTLIDIILKGEGALVTQASNGKEAVEKFSETTDLILMDIQMPELDGYEALKKIRAQGFKKPIVALTAHAMLEEKQRTKQAGFDAHLCKPIDREELIESLTHQLRKEYSSHH